jgi:hypothetical protein
VLFEKRLQQGLTDGSISVVFRRWRRPQVVAGRQYRSPIGMIEVEAVSPVSGEIVAGDAQAAGYASIEALLRDLKGADDGALYRVALHRSATADPRTELAERAELDAGDLGRLRRKLERLDAARPTPWTLATLRAIEARPGTRAGDLQVDLGWSDRLEFKLHVRKLKALGLTLSLRIGYRLSPRGVAYLKTVGPD